jgi:hypothetical protein
VLQIIVYSVRISGLWGRLKECNWGNMEQLNTPYTEGAGARFNTPRRDMSVGFYIASGSVTALLPWLNLIFPYFLNNFHMCSKSIGVLLNVYLLVTS